MNPILHRPSGALIARCALVLLLLAVALAAPAAAQVRSVTVLSPNGGEGYELGEPVTVLWSSAGIDTLRLDFSLDGGRQWRAVDTVAAVEAIATFIPEGYPTRRALVRLVDVDAPIVSDVSDRSFELLVPPSIMIFAPTTGEKIMRGATYTISWFAERVDRVTIRYSANGGATYSTLASNVDGRAGQFVWTVPNQPTGLGKIRIEEVGGPIFAETGLFSIIEPMPAVRILRPNGGERFFIGERIPVQWTAADVTTITLSYSSDGGATWTQFAGPMSPTLGTFSWNSGLPEGSYRVRIDAGNGISDDSDADFEIVRRPTPAITIEYPNGGEILAVDSVVTIRWQALDVTGQATVEYSLDSGRTWRPAGAGTADVTSGSLSWTVPGDTSSMALVRVIHADAGDTSDAIFAIIERTRTTLLILMTPNGGERWREGDTTTIRWMSIGVENVDIHLSTDGGASWTGTIAQNVPAAPQRLVWTVPHIADTSLASLLLRINATESASLWDASNGTFDFEVDILAALPGDDGAMRSLVSAPNPFVDAMRLRWHQPADGAVELRIFDTRGDLVARHDLGERARGMQSHVVAADDLPNGTYVVELRSGAGVVRTVVANAR